MFPLDINECEQSGAELCLNNGTCVNTNGSFTCMCAGGWSSVNCSSGKLLSVLV